MGQADLKQLRQNWRSKYERSKQLLQEAESASAFVGFNMDVDFIYKLTADDLGSLLTDSNLRQQVELKRGQLPTVIEDLTDFLAALLDAIDHSEPLEIDLANKSIREKIKGEFKAQKKSIGGQAGIISNLLAGLGVETIVYTPVLSKHQIKYLDQNLLYPQVVNGELVLDNVASCANAADIKNNLVFEYQQGLELPQFGVKADKDGRFILSDFLTDFSVLLPSSLIQRSQTLFNQIDRVIVSGYQDLADKNFYSRLRRAGEQLDEMKEANSDLLIHLELASQKKKELEEEIVSNIASKVDSLGFDSTELPQVLRSLNEINLASEVESTSTGLISVWKALKALVSELDLQRCQLHCDKYLVCVVKEDYVDDLTKLRDSLLLGGNSAVAKTSKGAIPDKQEIKSDYSCQISESGLGDMIEFKQKLDLTESFLEEGIVHFESEGLTLVVVPTLLAKKTETLVGLGDVISAASFAGELF